MLLVKVAPVAGAGNEAKVTFLRLGTLRDASVVVGLGASGGRGTLSRTGTTLNGASVGSEECGTVGGAVNKGSDDVLGVGGVCGLATVVRMLVSCSKASWWLSVKGARGEPGDGCCRACTMSCKPARMRSLDEASGIVTLVGNHSKVSHMCVARVSHSHTV